MHCSAPFFSVAILAQGRLNSVGFRADGDLGFERARALHLQPRGNPPQTFPLLAAHGQYRSGRHSSGMPELVQGKGQRYVVDYRVVVDTQRSAVGIRWITAGIQHEFVPLMSPASTSSTPFSLRSGSGSARHLKRYRPGGLGWGIFQWCGSRCLHLGLEELGPGCCRRKRPPLSLTLCRWPQKLAVGCDCWQGARWLLGCVVDKSVSLQGLAEPISNKKRDLHFPGCAAVDLGCVVDKSVSSQGLVEPISNKKRDLHFTGCAAVDLVSGVARQW